jgi:hypothetical protein
MSHYTEHTCTEINDEAHLIAALEAMGFEGKIEHQGFATQLYGYQGDIRAQKAHVIIRRKYVGQASNDIGFERQADGTYKALISEYDQKTGYGPAWMTKLKANYAISKVKAKAKMKGYHVTESKAGSKVKLVLIKY